MPWKLIEKIKGLLEVPYTFFRILVFFCTISFISIIYQNGLSGSLLAVPAIIVLYVLFFLFRATGKKINKEASDEYYYARYRKSLPPQVEKDLFEFLASSGSLPDFIDVGKGGIKVGYRNFLFRDYLCEDIGDAADMAGVANWLAETIYSRYKKSYEVKIVYFHDTEFQENHITGFRLEVKRGKPVLQKW